MLPVIVEPELSVGRVGRQLLWSAAALLQAHDTRSALCASDSRQLHLGFQALFSRKRCVNPANYFAELRCFLTAH